MLSTYYIAAQPELLHRLLDKPPGPFRFRRRLQTFFNDISPQVFVWSHLMGNKVLTWGCSVRCGSIGDRDKAYAGGGGDLKIYALTDSCRHLYSSG